LFTGFGFYALIEEVVQRIKEKQGIKRINGFQEKKLWKNSESKAKQPYRS
jgi:hypothetical protein